jgi:predicted amidohydrolase
MNLLLGQMDIAWEEVGANLGRVEAALEQHSPEPGTVVILPEMFATGFSMDPARSCGRSSDGIIPALSGWARRWGVWMLAGVALRDGDRVVNGAVGLDPGGEIVLRFDKLHGFTPAGEPAVYASGVDVVVGGFAGHPLAPFICYDLRFPEVFRRATDRGAEWMVVIANWPARRERHWLTLLQARAIENQCWVVGVNRAGSDPTATYSGRSVVVDPMGVIRCDAGEGERWVGCTVDLEETKRWREQFPALADRRVWRE